MKMSVINSMMQKLSLPSIRTHSVKSTKTNENLQSDKNNDNGIADDENDDNDDDDERLASLDALRAALASAPFFKSLLDNNKCFFDDNNQDNINQRHLKCAILVEKVNFYYNKKSNFILNDINLNVPQGKIYALIGPSGCGKTTLLKCILGLLKPNQGKIITFGSVIKTKTCPIPGPGIGYMPQNISLIPEFTIREIFLYFGKLYSMPMAFIQERINFLLSLLYLPDENRLISDLYDGQKWRISLAVSLIHSPPLLLLDEPTVGVDPLLRCSIWDHLNYLCREEGLTVLITSHYFDEASAAFKAGLMRNGNLLVEDCPDKLLDNFQTNSFEKIFLKLCQTDDKNIFEQFDKQTISRENSQFDHEHDDVKFAEWPCDYYLHLNNSNCITISRICQLINKNLTKIKRNYLLLFLFIMLPLLQMCLFCLTIGRMGHHLNVSIYNQEKPSFLSKKFLRTLDPYIINQIAQDSLTSSMQSIDQGSSWASIYLSENYSIELKKLFSGIKSLSQNDANVKLNVDMSNPVISQQLIYTIVKSLYEFIINSIKNNYLPDSVFFIPIQINDIYNNNSNEEIHLSFSHYFITGYVLTTVFLVHLILTAFLLIKEKMHGIIERYLVTGTSIVEVIIGHFMTQLFILFIQECAIILIVFNIFHVPLRGNIFITFLLIFLQGICGICFGLLISSICPNPISAMLLSSGTIFPLIIISGLLWPIQSMPLIMQKISKLLPLTLPIEALRIITITQDIKIKYCTIISAFVILTIYSFVLLIVSVIIFIKRKLV